jgi:uncharacterized protein YjbJ (UPF0337 family)
VRAAETLEEIMDKDRVDGAGKKVSDSIKEAIGKITGDKKSRVEGKANKAAGEAQNDAGSAKDAVRDAGHE